MSTLTENQIASLVNFDEQAFGAHGAHVSFEALSFASNAIYGEDFEVYTEDGLEVDFEAVIGAFDAAFPNDSFEAACIILQAA